MSRFRIPSLRSATIALAACAVIGAFATVPSPAQARVFVGFGFGFPGFYGPAYLPPPIYYPPPYYAAPPVVYTPPQVYTPGPAVSPGGGGQTCYAGAYVCPMERPVPSGAACYCLGNGGQRVTGRAN
ncbi:hypothetical protein [Rhodopila sp.]|uniref:hypothetical protein n=1 Tax=Rhodopila sp. TaxID=2480087 RepID=UPI003D1113D7